MKPDINIKCPKFSKDCYGLATNNKKKRLQKRIDKIKKKLTEE